MSINNTNKTDWWRSIKIQMVVIVALITLTTLFFVAGGLSKEYAQRVRESTVAATKNDTTTIARFLEQSLNLYANLARSIIFATDLNNQQQTNLMLEGIWKANKAVVSTQIFTIKDRETVLIGESSTEYTSPNINEDNRSQLVKQLVQQSRESLIALSAENKESKISIKTLVKSVETPIIQLLVKVPLSTKNEGAEVIQDYYVFFNLIPESLTTTMQNQGENFAVSIYNFDKKVVFSTINSRIKPRFSPIKSGAFDLLTRSDSSSQQLEQRVENKEGQPIQINYIPLKNFQVVIITQKILESEKAQEEKSIKKIFWNALMAFVLAFIFIFAYSSKLASRIGSLQRGTVMIANGEFNRKTGLSGKDEIGVLSEAIDKMADDLGTLVTVREQASRQEAELKMAENVQKTLVPRNNLTRDKIRTDFLFKPASECAGDWWGRFSISNEEELVIIADATGHGAHSALIAALAHAYFSSFEKGVNQPRLEPTPPRKMLEGLNTILYESGKGSLSMTALAMVINRVTRKVVCANGAHCFPHVVSKTKMGPISVSGDVLGITNIFTCQQKEFNLGSDERILIFTDGLFECQNTKSQAIKKRQFRDMMTHLSEKSNYEMVTEISKYIGKFFKDTVLSDDITTVLIEVDSRDSIRTDAIEVYATEVVHDSIKPNTLFSANPQHGQEFQSELSEAQATTFEDQSRERETQHQKYQDVSKISQVQSAFAEDQRDSRENQYEPNLSEANLSEANISEANISEANISEANISEENPSEVNQQASESNEDPSELEDDSWDIDEDSMPKARGA